MILPTGVVAFLLKSKILRLGVGNTRRFHLNIVNVQTVSQDAVTSNYKNY